MARKKSVSVTPIRLVVAVIIFALTAVAVIGMFLDILTRTTETAIGSSAANFRLFTDELNVVLKANDTNSTFLIISFIVSFVGLFILLIGQAGMIMKKNINFVSFIGAAIAVIGGILIFIAGLTLASSLRNINVGSYETTWSPAIGIYLGTIGSIIAGGLGFLSMTKVMR